MDEYEGDRGREKEAVRGGGGLLRQVKVYLFTFDIYVPPM